MGLRRNERTKIEFGDFQTPPGLADDVCSVLRARGLVPRTIVEPTCGTGNLLFAAVATFPRFSYALGTDVNEEYVGAVRKNLHSRYSKHKVGVEQLNFFEANWPARIAALPQPVLFLGNPPWVTSSDLGYLKSHNIPEKSNFHGRSGLDAITGKSNFDISEWILIKLLSWLDGCDAVLAMLCKTSVARKVLAFGWNAQLRVGSAAIYRIDSARHFGVSVDACLLVCELGARPASPRCSVFDRLDAARPSGEFGYVDGSIIANTIRYRKWKHLMGESQYKWRSGVKHDCAAVMELRRTGHMFENGHGEVVALEETLLYPMLKSSELAREGNVTPSRVMIVTQRRIGEDTSHIAESAPGTWRYLAQHKAAFDRRGSSIYKGKPPYSIFGVGEYTFAPWKVAISGLYKKLEFRVVGPDGRKPVVLDDTCYFIACRNRTEAEVLLKMLSSEPAREFFASFIFWDAKRPITNDLLRRLDLRRLAAELKMAAEFERRCLPGADTAAPADGQLALRLHERAAADA